MKKMRVVKEHIRRQIAQTIIREIKRLHCREILERSNVELGEFVLGEREAFNLVQAEEEGFGDCRKVVLGEVDVSEVAQVTEGGSGKRLEAVVAQVQRFNAIQHGEVVRVEHLQTRCNALTSDQLRRENST